jgi:acetoin utilization protein AcuC
MAEATGHPIDPSTPTPQSWRDYVTRRAGSRAPESMTEGAPADFTPWERGYDPDDPIDDAIMATRAAVFPHHGLFP